MPTTYNISITNNSGPTPDPLRCEPGDKITWTNNTTAPIPIFSLPSCVSPQTNPAPIAVGATTQAYTVNSGPGSFDYSYTASEIAADTRTGTIDVQS